MLAAAVRRWALLLALIIAAAALLYLSFWPVAADPVAWSPPPAPPLSGPYAPNDRLTGVERLPVGGGGPEDAAIGPDGRIYAGLADGRLMRLSSQGSRPESFSLLDGLCFANGVALAPDESYVLVAESASYRVRRYWLAGDRQGTADVFVDGLPGPDGVSSNGRGTFWLALVSPRNPLLDRLHPHPALKGWTPSAGCRGRARRTGPVSGERERRPRPPAAAG